MTTLKDNSTTPPKAASGLFGTIWEDGSSFDYENGYSANGVEPTLNRDKPVRVSKATRSNNATLVAVSLFFTALAAIITVLALLLVAIGTATSTADKNTAALQEKISEQDAYVVKMERPKSTEIPKTVILQNNRGDVIKCDVSAADNELVASAYVFCGPNGTPAVKIPLPEKTEFPGLLSFLSSK